MQLGQPLYSSEYVFVPARRLGGRGILLGGPLMHWFGRCLRSIHAGDGRQAAYINAAELARESERAGSPLLLREPTNLMVLRIVNGHLPLISIARRRVAGK